MIAESDDGTAVDGCTCSPRDTVTWERLRPSEHDAICSWKGAARYHDVFYGDVNREAAWCYPTPSDRAAPLVTDRVGFWRVVRIELDGADESSGRL